MRRRLHVPATLAAIGLAAALPAQPEGERAELEEKKAEKLAQPWLQQADWILDFDQAKARAKETGKPIFAYFTRSYSP